MSILGNIISSVLGRGQTAPPMPLSQPASEQQPEHHQSEHQPDKSAPPPTPTASQAPTPAPAAKTGEVDVAAVLDKRAKEVDEKLNWRTSIVDLMKLLNLDSSLAARKTLARELNYTGSTQDSATMNVWLHKQVMVKLEQGGGKLPSDLTH